MKIKQFILSIISIIIVQMMNGQKLEQNEVEQLKDVLNTKVATDLKVELKHNKAYFSIDEFNKTLDLRNDYEIAEDSLTQKAKKDLDKGPYRGSVYWKYNFETATNSDVEFKATKYQQLFCTISFKDQDIIVLKSQLNAYTSHHKISDSAIHNVEWTGDKYISILLTPIKVNNKINFELKGITISGKFERQDNHELTKNYTKSLRTILKREFKNLFELEEMTQLLKIKN